MAFLTLTDYADQIKTDILTRLTEGDDNNRLRAETKAIAQATSRLATRYDTNAIFALTGDARNQELVMCLVDMTLYHLHSRLTPGQVPEDRDKRYADAMEWLKMVASGDYNPDLPVVGDADEDGVDDRAVVQRGGRAPRNTYF